MGKESRDGQEGTPAACSSGCQAKTLYEEFRREAVQMMLDDHTAAAVAERLAISCPMLLYRWKQQQLHLSGSVATSLDDRVKELEAELHRVER